MDIQIVIKKGLVYSFLISTITLVYFLAVFSFEHFFHTYLGYKAFAISLLASSLIAIIFIPLRNKLQHTVDKLLFKNTTLKIIEENELLREQLIKTEKFRAVATLASGIAHEIKNPLTAIQAFNEYLPRKKDDPEFMAKYQSIMCKETKRINNLLQELLAFAKPNAPEMRNTNVDQVIGDIISLIEQKCVEQKISIQKNLNATTTIQADANQLKQAFLNILLNAIDAMPEGGTLTIETTKNRTRLIITIKDTGCGIPATELPHIFEPFYSNKNNGTGLGLSITQRIIEKHGGEIQVESIPTEYTTFKIHL